MSAGAAQARVQFAPLEALRERPEPAVALAVWQAAALGAVFAGLFILVLSSLGV